MKRKKSRIYHKWAGIILAIPLLLFCVTGILLNHRNLCSGISISRKWMPDRYKFEKWNGGLLRGTLCLSPDSIIIYGQGGAWLADSKGNRISDFNKGLPEETDLRAIRSMTLWNGTPYACSQHSVFHFDGTSWVEDNIGADERLSDITSHGDTLLVVGRNHVFVCTKSDRHGIRNDGQGTVDSQLSVLNCILPAPEGKTGGNNLFMYVWHVHTGEALGMAGRIIVDAVALILVLLLVTGLFPRHWKRFHTTKYFLWHNKIGRKTIILTILVVVTGWSLRPPMMVLLMKSHLPSFLSSQEDNPWQDHLRMMRYDETTHEWLLSANDGFYAFKSLKQRPVKIDFAPPVSVMGLNAWQQLPDGTHVVASFSGMYAWNRELVFISPVFGNDNAGSPKYGKGDELPKAVPFSDHAVSGFSHDFPEMVIAEYYNGTNALKQPDSMEYIPMSLYQFVLEIHAGRMIVPGVMAPFIYIFLVGLLVLAVLITGWRIRYRDKK